MHKLNGTKTTFTVNHQGDLEAQLILYLAQAAHIATADIVSCNCSPEYFLVNVAKGVSSIGPGEQARIQTEIPGFHLHALLDDLPRLASVAAYALRKVPAPQPNVTKEETARAKAIRHTQRAQLNLARVYGIVSQDEVSALRTGTSTLNLANEVTDCALLLKRVAARLSEKLTITQSEIDEALKLGNELEARVTRSVGKVGVQVSPEAERCNRIWTMLVVRYDKLRRIGSWLWGEEVSDHVPPLCSRPPKARQSASQTAAPGLTMVSPTVSSPSPTAADASSTKPVAA